MLIAAGCFVAAALAGDKPEPAKETKTPEGTHAVSKSIAIKSETKGIKLQTLTLGPDGMIYALLGPDRYGNKQEKAGEVQVLDLGGQVVRSWKVNFLSQAINCAP